MYGVDYWQVSKALVSIDYKPLRCCYWCLLIDSLLSDDNALSSLLVAAWIVILLLPFQKGFQVHAVQPEWTRNPLGNRRIVSVRLINRAADYHYPCICTANQHIIDHHYSCMCAATNIITDIHSTCSLTNSISLQTRTRINKTYYHIRFSYKSYWIGKIHYWNLIDRSTNHCNLSNICHETKRFHWFTSLFQTTQRFHIWIKSWFT